MSRLAPWIASCALALTFGSGCRSAGDQKLTLQPRPGLSADDYPEALERWTRADEIYDGLESILFLHATFHSPEFRRAFLLRHPNVFGRGSEQAGRLLLIQPGAEMELEFFLAVSASSEVWNDLHRETSLWRVTLQSDDLEPVDAKIQRVPVNGNVRVMYPYLSDFDRTYSVRFPWTTLSGQQLLTPGTRRIVLYVTSAMGRGQMVWRFARARGTASGLVRTSTAAQ